MQYPTQGRPGFRVKPGMTGGVLARNAEPPPNWRVSEPRSEAQAGHCRDVACSVSDGSDRGGKRAQKNRPDIPKRSVMRLHGAYSAGVGGDSRDVACSVSNNAKRHEPPPDWRVSE